MKKKLASTIIACSVAVTQISDITVFADSSFKDNLNKNHIDNKERKITVVPKSNEKPVINGAYNKQIEFGTEFNPLDGVTALDREDGNLTNNIIIKEDSVNINKSGVYQITYEVTDKKGLSATKTINVTIEGTGIFNSLVIVEISIVVLLIIGISSITVAIISNRKKK